VSVLPAAPLPVRPAGPGDDIVVAALIAEYAADFEYDLGEQDVVGEGLKAREYYEAGGLWVADVDGEVVGCVAFEPWGEDEGGSRARMKRLYVLRDHRGKGLGRALCEAVMEGARAAGHKVMILDTTQGMKEARALYRALGFTEWEPDYESPCRGTVYMRRDL
jgi:putative acetyltransferase